MVIPEPDSGSSLVAIRNIHGTTHINHDLLGNLAGMSTTRLQYLMHLTTAPFPCNPLFINWQGNLNQVLRQDGLAVHTTERGGAASRIDFLLLRLGSIDLMIIKNVADIGIARDRAADSSRIRNHRPALGANLVRRI